MWECARLVRKKDRRAGPEIIVIGVKRQSSRSEIIRNLQRASTRLELEVGVAPSRSPCVPCAIAGVRIKSIAKIGRQCCTPDCTLFSIAILISAVVGRGIENEETVHAGGIVTNDPSVINRSIIERRKSRVDDAVCVEQRGTIVLGVVIEADYAIDIVSPRPRNRGADCLWASKHLLCPWRDL